MVQVLFAWVFTNKQIQIYIGMFTLITLKNLRSTPITLENPL